MKILDLYLARSIMLGVLVALLIICAIDWLGDLFYQVGKMNSGDKFSEVIVLTLLDVPHKVFEFLPSSMLIGALFSLGQFAAGSEMVAVNACGCSRFRVGMSACAAGLVITILLSVLVEMYVPLGERISLSMQQSEQENILLASDESYWVREQDRFIKVGQAVSQVLLNDVEIYTFNEEGEPESISQATSAFNIRGSWQLNEFHRSHINENKVIAESFEEHVVPKLFLSHFLQSVTLEPNKMSVQRLHEYIGYLEQNHLDVREYKVALFKRMAVPFVGLSMLLLALPLVFRPRQLGGAGQRLLIGIVIALLIYIFVEVLTNGAVVYRLSPVLVAFLPVTIILLLSVLVFRFSR